MKNRNDLCFQKYNTKRKDLIEPNINHDKLIEKKISKYLYNKYLNLRRDFYFRSKQLPFPKISRQRAGRALSNLTYKGIVTKYNDKHTVLWKTNFSPPSK